MAPQKALRLHSHHLVDGSGGLMPAMRENSRSLSSNETGFNLAAAIDSRAWPLLIEAESQTRRISYLRM